MIENFSGFQLARKSITLQINKKIGVCADVHIYSVANLQLF